MLETIVTACRCEVELMNPVRIISSPMYTHQCNTCQGGITYERNDNYNKYFGYSGYDD